MAGPHRALAETRNAVESAFRDAGIDAGSRVLLAVSGGSDSMALAQAALFVASRAGVLAASLTVDHGWRQDSPDEARATRDRLAGLGADPQGHLPAPTGPTPRLPARPKGALSFLPPRKPRPP